jgi:hypothetical protein
MCSNTEPPPEGESRDRDTIQKEKRKAMLPWPEDRDPGQSHIGAVYQRWTYSYMNRILDKGAKQQILAANGDGTSYLSQDDLYFVPPAMESNNLAKLF